MHDDPSGRLSRRVEHDDAARLRRAGDLAGAWHHLERAHILSQPHAWAHVRVHAAMLGLAIRTRDVREGFGQIARIVVAAPGSTSGRYPKGNTGRARVSMFAPMPLPDDLRVALGD